MEKRSVNAVVTIMSDPNFSESTWCRELQKSLTRRLREKRIAYTETGETCPAGAETVFLLASDLAWTERTIRSLNGAGVQPILLCNQLTQFPGCLYSCVCSDVSASMKNLAESLHRAGKKRAALCGVNPCSIADISRAEALTLWKNGNLESLEILECRTTLEAHFAALLPRIGEFDALVCTNDFAAVSLLRCAEREGKDLSALLPIVSCAGSLISSCYCGRIRSLNVNFDRFGSAALDLYELLRKKTYLTGATVKLAWQYEDAGSAERQPLPKSAPPSDDALYRDAQFAEMLAVERLLFCLEDETDRRIVRGLAEGKSVQSVAESCFLSGNAVKYRIRRLLSAAGVKTRGELLHLLEKYQPPQLL